MKTLGATSPGICRLLIMTIIPKNDASSVPTKKNTMATKKRTVLEREVAAEDVLMTRNTANCNNMLMNCSEQGQASSTKVS